MEKKALGNTGKWISLLLKIQGFYYFLSGIWPTVHIQSFLWVTGPKEEIWLVKTFGLIIAVIGITLLTGSKAESINWPVFMLAWLSAICFVLTEFYYVFHQIIPGVFLADALVQITFLICWLVLMLVIYQSKKTFNP